MMLYQTKLSGVWAWVLLAIASDAISVPFLLDKRQQGGSELFNWSSIEPSWDLDYHSCYGRFQCARLTLPMDWLDLSNNHTIALAVIKLPAQVEASKSNPNYGGPVITNPGGPGGSGIQYVVNNGDFIQRTVDSLEKSYDIVSFDPRGVFKTTPEVDCFQGDTVARNVWEYRKSIVGHMNASIEAPVQQLIMAKAYGQLCNNVFSKEGSDNDGNILRFASSASVARDMLELVSKIDSLATQTNASDSQEALSSQVQEPARLQYWGLSYGTYLGNTFASMFPDRVGRLILDGVTDAYDYVSGVSSTLCRCHSTTLTSCRHSFTNSMTQKGLLTIFTRLVFKLDLGVRYMMILCRAVKTYALRSSG